MGIGKICSAGAAIIRNTGSSDFSVACITSKSTGRIYSRLHTIGDRSTTRNRIGYRYGAGDGWGKFYAQEVGSIHRESRECLTPTIERTGNISYIVTINVGNNGSTEYRSGGGYIITSPSQCDRGSIDIQGRKRIEICITQKRIIGDTVRIHRT